MALADLGHDVLFVDVKDATLDELGKRGYRTAKAGELGCDLVDIFFITVPTPSRADGSVELRYLEEALRALASGPLRCARAYPVVVLKSTLPPGTTRGMATPILERWSEKRAGENFGVVFEPEFLREDSSFEDAKSPRMYIVGSDDASAIQVISWLRRPFGCPIVQTTTEEAELEKYVHNLLNANKISFFNEMRIVGERLGVDVDKVFGLVVETAEASYNHRYGTRNMGPFGGMCLPKDTSGFLRWAEESLELPLPLLRAVIDVNETVKARQSQFLSPLSLEFPVALEEPVKRKPRAVRRRIRDRKNAPVGQLEPA
jgi:UDPglucose 6-dehydrogenase